MAKFVKLTTSSSPMTYTFVNIDCVISMVEGKQYTILNFNFSVNGLNGGAVYYLYVLETPQQILDMIT